MHISDYQNFLLRFKHTTEQHYTLEVPSLNHPLFGDEDKGPTVVLPPPISDLHAALEESGMLLFNSIFSNPILPAFEDTYQEHQQQEHTGLRLQLNFDDVALQRLPWELLRYDGAFLALKDGVSVTRAVPTLVNPFFIEREESPFRILAVISSPRDLPALSAAHLVTLLNRATRFHPPQDMLVMDIIENPSLPALRAQLRRHPYYTFHFFGYARYRASQDRRLIALASENGNDAVWLRIESLTRELLAGKTIQTVVLNLYSESKESNPAPVPQIAERLVSRGIPAVVSSLVPMSEVALSFFWRGLYGGLSEGAPVDMAVQMGRHGVENRLEGHEEWYLPTLWVGISRLPESESVSLWWKVWLPLVFICLVLIGAGLVLAGDLGESAEHNATSDEALISAPLTPPLEIMDFALQPTRPRAGEEVTITYHLQNTGSAPLTSIEATLYLHTIDTPQVLASVPPFNLARAEEIRQEIPYIFAQPGLYIVYLEIWFQETTLSRAIPVIVKD